MIETATRYGGGEVQNVKMLWDNGQGSAIAAALEDHIRYGRLNKSDFGWYPPAMLKEHSSIDSRARRTPAARRSRGPRQRCDAMTMVREFGRKKPPQRRNRHPVVAVALGVFTFGALAMLGQDYLPRLHQWSSLFKMFEGSSAPSRAERLGRASTAPLQNECAKQ